MKIRPLGALLCGAMLLVTTAAFGGDPIPGVDVKLGKDPSGMIVASGNTNKNGTFTVGRIEAGNYNLTIGRIPAVLDQTTASITIIAGGQQEIVKTEKGIMVTNQGGREIIITIPIPSRAFTISYPVGFSLGTLPVTFTATVKTVELPASPL
jgi:hypothetical protein